MNGIADVLDALEPGPVSPPSRARAKKHEPLIYRAPPPTVIKDITELLMEEPMPVRYVVPGWLPEGLTILASNPKMGKSTLMLQIEVAIATGGKFWGEDVPAARVLMIDLETNERRLRRKLVEAGIVDLPEGMLRYATDWPRGLLGIEQIAQCLDEDPLIRLVVIDTLQRFRDSGSGKQNAYAADYEALAPLQQLCRDRPGLSIVCVHHKRKAATDDPIDSINGSAAIAGAADGIWIMSRKGSDYTLHIQARDWEKNEDEFRIERDNGKWRLIDGPRFTANEAEVLKYLDIGGGMTAPQLAEALQVGRQTAYERLKRMQTAGMVRHDGSAWHASL